MEHRAFLPGGKTKHRLSIVNTQSLSELERLPLMAQVIRPGCVAAKGGAVFLRIIQSASKSVTIQSGPGSRPN